MEQSILHRRGVGLRGVDPTSVSEGYTLFTTLTSTGIVHLIDNNGKEVHRWSLPYRPGRHARILPNGNLAYNGVHPDSPNLYPLWQKYRGGVMMEVDPWGKPVREYRDPYAHHDQNHLPNGQILYTTVEELTADQAKTIPGGIEGSETPDGKIYADCIKQVDPETGEILFYWRAIDHLNPKVFALHGHYAREHWPLINSVSLMHDGNILASLRSVSAVVVISRATGDIIWHLDSSIVSQQHCATELPNSLSSLSSSSSIQDQKDDADASTILIFDNGSFRPGASNPSSRVIEVQYSPSGDPQKDKSIVWSYNDQSNPMAFYSPFMGSAQRLKNGNTLITEAVFGRIFEVDSAGKVCWEFVNPEFGRYRELMTKNEEQGRKDGVGELVDIGFDFPANAVFRAYKYLPEEVPWLKFN